MWWTRDKNDDLGTGPRCPFCVTHPVLVQSGYGDEKSLRCPVCKALFNSRGAKYDPGAKTEKDKNHSSIDDDLLREQEELWDSLWGN